MKTDETKHAKETEALEAAENEAYRQATRHDEHGAVELAEDVLGYADELAELRLRRLPALREALATMTAYAAAYKGAYPANVRQTDLNAARAALDS